MHVRRVPQMCGLLGAVCSVLRAWPVANRNCQCDQLSRYLRSCRKYALTAAGTCKTRCNWSVRAQTKRRCGSGLRRWGNLLVGCTWLSACRDVIARAALMNQSADCSRTGSSARNCSFCNSNENFLRTRVTRRWPGMACTQSASGIINSRHIGRNASDKAATANQVIP